MGPDSQIIFKGNLKPILARKVPVFAIKPYRHQIAPNPMYRDRRTGKASRYLMPVEVKLGRLRNWVTRRGRSFTHKQANPRVRKALFYLIKRFLSHTGGFIVVGLLIVLFLQTFPHLLR
ncbi:MAG: hypothetical protein AAGF28_12590 [Pseudomonadota bacterium]